MVVSAGGELAPLVHEPHDRVGERDGDEGGGDEQECDLAQAPVERAPEPGLVAPGCESGERREEHGGHRDREDPLRKHVEAERLVDRRRCELGVEQP